MKATHSLKHGDIFLTPKSRKAVPDLPLTRVTPPTISPRLYYIYYIRIRVAKPKSNQIN